MAGRKKANQKSGSQSAGADVDLFADEPAPADDIDTESARIAFRWTRHHVDMLKRVADLIGVPYQTYVKTVLYRQATQDLKDFAADTRPKK